MNRIAIVSGRGYGKTLLMGQLANPEAPTVEELENAIPLEGVSDLDFSFGAGDDVTVYPATNYTASMSFMGDNTITNEAMWENLCRAFSLGRWAYTPAEELLHRLNTRLQGKEPLSAINTRYWRNL